MHSFYKEYQVNPILSPYIECIWMESYTQLPEVKGKTLRVVPDNTVELIFLESRMMRSFTDGNHTEKFASHLSGLKTKPQEICVEGRVILAVRFKPSALRFFTEVNLRETVDATLEPCDIFSKSILTLEDRLHNAESTLEQIKLTEDYFIKQIQKVNKAPDPLFEFVLTQILLNKGRIKISSLSDKSGYSIKTLERNFIKNLGVVPAKYAKMLRFINSVCQLNNSTKPEKPDWSSIAFCNGYYDQNHFIKEIKRYTGLTPKNYFETDRNLQLPVFSKS